MKLKLNLGRGAQRLQDRREQARRVLPTARWRRLYADCLEDTTLGDGKAIECAALIIEVVELPHLTQTLSPAEVFSLLSAVTSALEPQVEAPHSVLMP